MAVEPILRDDLLIRFPGLLPELSRVEGWFDVPLRYALRVDPMAHHAVHAEMLMARAEADAISRLRIKAILRRLESGDPVWPLFVFDQDEFLLEGWHRLIVFKRLGHQTVPVVLVSRDAPEPSPHGFRQAQIVADGCRFFSARWMNQQIGHLRVNHTTIPFPGERTVETTFVLPAFRRRGVAQALYNAADAALKAEGLSLVPSPRPSMSDAAVRLWEKRSGER